MCAYVTYVIRKIMFRFVSFFLCFVWRMVRCFGPNQIICCVDTYINISDCGFDAFLLAFICCSVFLFFFVFIFCVFSFGHSDALNTDQVNSASVIVIVCFCFCLHVRLFTMVLRVMLVIGVRRRTFRTKHTLTYTHRS